jgi:hypothetical protein
MSEFPKSIPITEEGPREGFVKVGSLAKLRQSAR